MAILCTTLRLASTTTDTTAGDTITTIMDTATTVITTAMAVTATAIMGMVTAAIIGTKQKATQMRGLLLSGQAGQRMCSSRSGPNTSRWMRLGGTPLATRLFHCSCMKPEGPHR